MFNSKNIIVKSFKNCMIQSFRSKTETMTVHTLPDLYDRSRNDKLKVWNIRVEGEEDGEIANIITSHGYVDGVIRETKPTEVRGKNVGKSNETTAFEQAILQAKSKWVKKTDKGFCEVPPPVGRILELPMLAHSFEKKTKKVIWPGFAQPKLNGIRCLCKKVDEETIKFISRGNKSFETMEHLIPELLEVLEVGQFLDGELYNHNLTFQQICSAVKNEKGGDVDPRLIQLHFYDFYDPTKEDTFEDRIRNIFDIALPKLTDNLVAVATKEVKSEKEFFKLHDDYVANGYEGIMFRNKQGKYILEHRSNDLLKYKDFIDEEFEIVGGEECQGDSVGQAKLICITKDGEEFTVRCKGSDDYRKRLLKDLHELIGKQLTVRYQNLSDDGVPVFPVGIVVRDYE